MPDIPVERIKQIKSFPSLVKFLRDELDWPLESDEIEELVFEYEADELGIEPKIAVNIKEIKQLRPLVANQPWGIFYIGFEPKRLPVVVLRRVLQKLVIKKRQSAQPAHRSAWRLHDLLFISSYGEEHQRAITFAHFSEDEESKLPTLRVIGWDSQDTPLHMDRCIQELQNLTFDEELSPDKWREQWSEAFTLEHREVITTSKALAKKLAALATRIRQRVNKVLAVESEKGPMRQLYKAFQETLIHDLDEDDFADMYAQTITYGLFSTKKSRPAGLVAENLLDMIPKTNPFLKELLSTFLTVGGRKGKIDFDELGIDDVVQTLRDADMDAVLRDFEDRNPLEDPVIHFYEGFLKEYDAKKKVKRGVFYTPRPVVSFIVRSVDEILRKDFGLEYGLADTTTWGEMQTKNKDIKIPVGISENEPFVQILDPAVGTGTFLVEVIDLIYKTMKSKWEKEGHLPLEFNKLWNEYVPKHLLPRLYGFELMMAPYAIAHMKIGLKLFETGYRFDSDERARIYLTNTLEEPKDITEYFEQVAPALAHEAQSANKVKSNTPMTVIIGNPPYANYGQMNRNPWILGLLDEYKKDIEEKKLNLDDDFIKFIRVGQHYITRTGSGTLGYITNNTYIDGVTHRQMRKCLLETFDVIQIVDLHGSSKKKEKCPDGSKDENVFDITQGVSIGVFKKRNRQNRTPKVQFSEIWGLRNKKYQVLINSNFKKLNPISLQDINRETCLGNFFFLTPKSFDNIDEYCKGFSIESLFTVSGSGFQTDRDSLFVDESKANLAARMKTFYSDDGLKAGFREKYRVENSSSYDILAKRRSTKYDRSFLKLCLYRPFDKLWCYYNQNITSRAAWDTMRNIIDKGNLVLISMRQYEYDVPEYCYFFVTNIITERRIFISNRGAAHIFPLFLYTAPNELAFDNDNVLTNKDGRYINLATKFVSQVAKYINAEFTNRDVGDLDKTFGPKDVFNYIYGVSHSPSYRTRYAEFLKIDFPRVPVTSNIDLFRELCISGGKLVSLHLMESDTLNSHITTFTVSGDNAVTKVAEKKKTLADVKNGRGKLFINKTQYFDNLPEEVWNFHIGGYQVCHKWLADRKKAKRKLSAEDIEHYHKIVVALNETIKIMKQIDEVIEAHGGWPIK